MLRGVVPMMNKALKWILAIVVLLSVLSPVAAYFGVVAVFIAAIEARKTRQVLAELKSDTPVLVLVFCVLLSMIYSKDLLMSVGAAVMLCLNLGLYLVLAVILKEMDAQKFYRLLNTACIIACIFGLYQFASGNLKVEKSWVDEKTFGSITRVYSTLLNPNIFAAYLAINLSFALSRLKSLREDLLLTFNIGLASVCLLLTYSRGGFAAFGTAMLVLCLLKEKRKGLSIYTAAMAAAFFLMNSAGPNNRADITSVYQDSSSLYRLEIWKAALAMFLDSPINGNGFGTTWYYLSSGSDKLYRYILHSHNIYLQVAAEMGIMGLCGFACLIWVKLSESLRLLRDKEAGDEAYILQGFIACTAGILVHGLIDAVIFVPALSMVFMGYFALHSKVTASYGAKTAYALGALGVSKLKISHLPEGKGIPELFWSKDTGNNKYKEEESKAC